MTTGPGLAVTVRQALIGAADRAAKDSGFAKRESKLGSAAFAQALVTAALHEPLPALEDYARAAADPGAGASPRAFDSRFGKASAESLRPVASDPLGRPVTGTPPPAAPLGRSPAAEVQDATHVALPDGSAAAFPGRAGGEASVKVRARLDLKSGKLTGPVEPAKTADRKTALTPDSLPGGSPLVRDLGLRPGGVRPARRRQVPAEPLPGRDRRALRGGPRRGRPGGVAGEAARVGRGGGRVGRTRRRAAAEGAAGGPARRPRGGGAPAGAAGRAVPREGAGRRRGSRPCAGGRCW